MGDARGKKDDDDCVQESTFSFFFFFFLSSLSLDIWTPKGKEGRSLASLQRQKNRGCCFHCDLKGTEKGRAEKEVGKGKVVEKRALSGKGGGGGERGENAVAAALFQGGGGPLAEKDRLFFAFALVERTCKERGGKRERRTIEKRRIGYSHVDDSSAG